MVEKLVSLGGRVGGLEEGMSIIHIARRSSTCFHITLVLLPLCRLYRPISTSGPDMKYRGSKNLRGHLPPCSISASLRRNADPTSPNHSTGGISYMGGSGTPTHCSHVTVGNNDWCIAILDALVKQHLEYEITAFPASRARRLCGKTITTSASWAADCDSVDVLEAEARKVYIISRPYHHPSTSHAHSLPLTILRQREFRS